MADDSAAFAVTLDAKDVTKSAVRAAEELAKLKKAIEGDQRELKELEARMKAMQGGASMNVAAFKSLQKQVQEKKDALAKSSEAYTALGGKLTDIGKKTQDTGSKTASLRDRMGSLGEKLSAMPGPVGAAGGSFSNLAKQLMTPRLAAVAL